MRKGVSPRRTTNLRASSNRETLISHTFDKSLLPRPLFLPLSKLHIEFPVCFSINLVGRPPIRLSFITIIKPILVNFCFLKIYLSLSI
jgi:hypothetical protein